MKAATLVSVIFFGSAALALTVWIGRYNADVKVITGNPADPSQAIPEPVKTGPQPRAVAETTVYDFGTLEHNAEGQHKFVIRNEGEAPLQLLARPEDSTCSCTIGSLGENTLQPGEQTEIEMTWHIKNPSTQFEHSAVVRTNDPENEQIRFRVRGIVGKLMVTKPGVTWDLGSVEDDQPASVSGTVHSEILDEFEISEVETSTPLLTAEIIPLDADVLAAFSEPSEQSRLMMEKMEAEAANGGPAPSPEAPQLASTPPAKCGYEIKVTLSPGIPVGPFREQIKIHTDVRGGQTLTVYVEGTRPGPIAVFPPPGVRWNSRDMRLRLDRFAASEGKTINLSMYVKNADDSFKIEDIEKSDDFLNVTVKKDETVSGKNRQRLLMSFEIAPGVAPEVRDRSNPSTVTFKTNHPVAAEIKFSLEFVSF